MGCTVHEKESGFDSEPVFRSLSSGFRAGACRKSKSFFHIGGIRKGKARSSQGVPGFWVHGLAKSVPLAKGVAKCLPLWAEKKKF
jgi:hypothetical protein